MRLLLDTHVLLWAIAVPRALPSHLRTMMVASGNEVFVSTANFLEIAMKRSADRRSKPAVSAERAHELSQLAGYTLLKVSAEHAIAVETLALFHGDPVDRLLLAQAQVEGLQLVTHDERLAAYDSRTILF